jgi:DNA-binding MurR/RpiR family transcriptional regulator
VLAHKTDLSLTTEQIAKLEPLAKTLEEQNKPVIEELRKQGATRARGMSEEQRNELRAQSEKIRENRTKALEELRTVLNEDQMKKARELIRPEGRRGGK